MTYESQVVDAAVADKARQERDENGRALGEAREIWKDVEGALRARSLLGAGDLIDGLNSAVLRMRQALYGTLVDPRRMPTPIDWQETKR